MKVLRPGQTGVFCSEGIKIFRYVGYFFYIFALISILDGLMRFIGTGDFPSSGTFQSLHILLLIGFPLSAWRNGIFVHDSSRHIESW